MKNTQDEQPNEQPQPQLQRPDYEAAKAEWEAQQASATNNESEFQANFTPPAGPPNPPVRHVAPQMVPVVRYLEAIIQNEGLVLDLCLERAIEIVKFHINRGLVGTDLLGGADGSGGFGHINLVGLSIPLVPRFYEEVQKMIETSRKEIKELIKKGTEEAAKAETNEPVRILTPN